MFLDFVDYLQIEREMNDYAKLTFFIFYFTSLAFETE